MKADPRLENRVGVFRVFTTCSDRATWTQSVGAHQETQTFDTTTASGRYPVNFVDPFGGATLIVNGQYRTDTYDFINGHGWVTVVNDDGSSVTRGNYPGGVQSFDNIVHPNPSGSFSFDISQSQADAVINVYNRDHYNFFTDNCVDRVEDALKAAGIDHPSFNLLGVSEPNNLVNWLKELKMKKDQELCP